LEIFITFNFLSPLDLINYLSMAIPIIIYNILLFLAIKKHQHEFRKPKMMMKACLVVLVLYVAYIFVPVIYAHGASPEEWQIIAIIFSLYFAGYMVPNIITQGVILAIFGIKNKEKYRYFIFVAGVLFIIYYTSMLTAYIFAISNFSIYMTLTSLFMVLFSCFFAVNITAYVLLLLHGILYRQNLFKVLGITMVSLQTFKFFLTPIMFSLAIQFFPL